MYGLLGVFAYIGLMLAICAVLYFTGRLPR
jgi:hypothetical protein